MIPSWPGGGRLLRYTAFSDVTDQLAQLAQLALLMKLLKTGNCSKSSATLSAVSRGRGSIGDRKLGGALQQHVVTNVGVRPTRTVLGLVPAYGWAAHAEKPGPHRLAERLCMHGGRARRADVPRLRRVRHAARRHLIGLRYRIVPRGLDLELGGGTDGQSLTPQSADSSTLGRSLFVQLVTGDPRDRVAFIRSPAAGRSNARWVQRPLLQVSKSEAALRAARQRRGPLPSWGFRQRHHIPSSGIRRHVSRDLADAAQPLGRSTQPVCFKHPGSESHSIACKLQDASSSSRQGKPLLLRHPQRALSPRTGIAGANRACAHRLRASIPTLRTPPVRAQARVHRFMGSRATPDVAAIFLSHRRLAGFRLSGLKRRGASGWSL